MPEIAIGYDQLGSYVLVVDDQSVVQRRGVKLGLQTDGYRVIDEGLTGEEWVITNGLLRAIPGRSVTPVKEDRASSPPPGPPCPQGQAREKREKRPMISRFFIERPIFANVIAIVTMILGMVCFFNLPCPNIRHRAAHHPDLHPLSRGQRRSGGGYGGDSHRTVGQRGGRLHLHVFHQRQRRQLHPDHHL